PSFFWRAMGFNFAFAVAYVTAELTLCSDGSFFSFTMAVRRPWDLLCCNFPCRRSTADLLTSAPALLNHQAIRTATSSQRLYAITSLCWPGVGIMATRMLYRTADKRCSAYFNVASLTTPLFTFGFPTEVWMTCALFWPALCCCACANPSSVPFWLSFLLLP